MKGYIYKFENKINGKVYIGQTRQSVKTRYKQHIRDSKKDKYPIHAAIQKYGIESFDFSVIKEVEYENKDELINELNKLETNYILQFNSLCPNGYNVESGGNVHDIIRDVNNEEPMDVYAFMPRVHNLGPIECIIYLCLQLFIRDDKTTITMRRLSSVLHMAPATLRKNLKKIERDGLIVLDKTSSKISYRIVPVEWMYGVPKDLILKDNLTITTRGYIIKSIPYMSFKNSDTPIIKMDEIIRKQQEEIKILRKMVDECEESLMKTNNFLKALLDKLNEKSDTPIEYNF